MHAPGEVEQSITKVPQSMGVGLARSTRPSVASGCPRNQGDTAREQRQRPSEETPFWIDRQPSLPDWHFHLEAARLLILPAWAAFFRKETIHLSNRGANRGTVRRAVQTRHLPGNRNDHAGICVYKHDRGKRRGRGKSVHTTSTHPVGVSWSGNRACPLAPQSHA